MGVPEVSPGTNMPQLCDSEFWHTEITIIVGLTGARKGLRLQPVTQLPLLPWPPRFQWDADLLGTGATQAFAWERERPLCYLASFRCLSMASQAMSPLAKVFFPLSTQGTPSSPGLTPDRHAASRKALDAGSKLLPPISLDSLTWVLSLPCSPVHLHPPHRSILSLTALSVLALAPGL